MVEQRTHKPLVGGSNPPLGTNYSIFSKVGIWLKHFPACGFSFGMDVFRLMTLNLAHGRGLALYQGFQSEDKINRQMQRIRALFDSLRLDIVCLQEVDESSHWNKHLNLLDLLKAETGLAHGFVGVHNRRSGRKQLAYGNAILSRAPVECPEVVSFGQKTIGEKGFLCAETVLRGQRFALINVHLDFRSRRRRLTQVEALIRFIHDKLYPADHTPPVRPIICGDFNASQNRRGDAVYQLFGYILSHDAYRLYPERGSTFPAHRPVRGIDFVFMPSDYYCRSVEIVRSLVSDHLPVMIEFEAARS